MTKPAPRPAQALRRFADQLDDSSTDVWKRASAISSTVCTSESEPAEPQEPPSPSIAPSLAADPDSAEYVDAQGEMSAAQTSQSGTENDGESHVDMSLQQAQVMEYEYMDIRSSLKATGVKGSSSSMEGPGPADSVERDEGIGGESNDENQEDKGHRGEQDEEWVVQTGAVACRAGFRDGAPPAGTEQEEEYEEMGVTKEGSNTVDEVEYQNMPSGKVPMSPGGLNAGLGKYMKVRAGMGEPVNTSFDNPDYWHSRLFHKQDALRT